MWNDPYFNILVVLVLVDIPVTLVPILMSSERRQYRCPTILRLAISFAIIALAAVEVVNRWW